MKTLHTNSTAKRPSRDRTQIIQEATMSLFAKKEVPASVYALIKSLLARSPDGIITLAPGVARRILEETNWPGQRRLNLSRLAGKIRLINEGEFDPNNEGIKFALLPDGSIFLIDGQHRLTAIVKTNIATKVHARIVKADDMAHVRRLYAACDSKESVRTQNEVLVSTGVATALGLSRQMTNAIFNAMPILLSDMEMAPNRANLAVVRDTQYRLSQLPRWSREAAKWEEITSRAEGWLRRKLRQSAVTAAGLYTLRFARVEAEKFWTKVAENDGLRKTDPRKRLIEDFINRDLTKGSSKQALQRISSAWNAAHDGRELQRIKCNESTPIYFKGTPKETFSAAA